MVILKEIHIPASIAVMLMLGGDDGFGSTKITGTGAVAEIIPTANHGRVSLMCPESPEYWYQDLPLCYAC